MHTYIARYVRDFSEFEACADALLRAPISEYPWGGEYRPEAWGQLAWNEDGIFVRLRAEEPAPRAVETADNTDIYCDSCLEFFLNPCPGEVVFCNFETNANGAMYLAFGPEYEPDRTLMSRAAFDGFSLKTVRDAAGWEVRYRVPAAYFRQFAPAFALEDGCVLAGNFYKCGDATEFPHYGCWSPIRTVSETPNFYHVCDFGEIFFKK